MYFTTRHGVIGVVLAVALGLWLASVLSVTTPALADYHDDLVFAVQ